jgi:hypothetical protein
MIKINENNTKKRSKISNKNTHTHEQNKTSVKENLENPIILKQYFISSGVKIAFIIFSKKAAD